MVSVLVAQVIVVLIIEYNGTVMGSMLFSAIEGNCSSLNSIVVVLRNIRFEYSAATPGIRH